jgi:hypothetical protein
MTAATQTAQDIASILEDVDAATAAPQAEASAVMQAGSARNDPAPSAQVRQAPASSSARTAQENDGIDMVELDAMLDQVLSVAPKNRRPDAGRVASEARAGAAAPQAGAVQEEELSASSGAVTGVAAASAAGSAAHGAEGAAGSSAEDDVGAMLLEADLKQKNLAGSAVVPMAEESSAKNAASQAAKTIPMAGFAKETEGASLSTPSSVAPGMDPSALSRAQAEIRRLTREITGLRVENRDFKNRITSLSSEMQDLRDNMDKHAARAAAKVIREELMTAISGELE